MLPLWHLANSHNLFYADQGGEEEQKKKNILLAAKVKAIKVLLFARHHRLLLLRKPRQEGGQFNKQSKTVTAAVTIVLSRYIRDSG